MAHPPVTLTTTPNPAWSQVSSTWRNSTWRNSTWWQEGGGMMVEEPCLNSTCLLQGDWGPTEGVNVTRSVDHEMTGKDASWILTSAVIIFTMQTGFGLLESGCVHPKNEVNIMVKNALDVVFGGITYWAVGFGLSFGSEAGTNPFVGVGYFFFDADDENMGYSYALFLFQLSFSTTATTIVSGAMAERAKLSAYIVFSFLNTVIYCIPAHWVWAESGFLYQMGAIDIAGCGPVHLVGGTTGLVATMLLGPRKGAFDNPEREPLPSPLKAILGLFMLWWGWLRFNSGSVFIISDSSEWRLAVRAAVNTIVSSMAGGITSVFISVIYGTIFKTVRYDIGFMINGVLGSLVSITSMCTICRPWEALVAGAVGAVVAALSEMGVHKLKVDDPVGVVAVHGSCAVWGLLCVGLFLEPEYSRIPNNGGLFKTGQVYQLGIQALTAISIIGWTVITSLIILLILEKIMGLRLTPEQEAMGADILEHGIMGMFSEKMEAQRAVDTVIDGQEGTTCEFKKRLNHLLLEMALSCDRNDLSLNISSTDANSVTFHLKSIEKSPSLDSGIDVNAIHI